MVLLNFTQAVVMPTVPEYPAFKEAPPDVQKNMTFYYNASASLRSWSALSDEGSAALSGVFGEIFEEGQSKSLIFPKNVPLRTLTCGVITSLFVI